VERRYASRISIWTEKMPSSADLPEPITGAHVEWSMMHIVNRSPVTLESPMIELWGVKVRRDQGWTTGKRPPVSVRYWAETNLLIPACMEIRFSSLAFDIVDDEPPGGAEAAFTPTHIKQIVFSEGPRAWSVSGEGLQKGKWTAPVSTPAKLEQRKGEVQFKRGSYDRRNAMDCGEGA
jgi:hypothetical protein